jgi:hypothetical protein
MIRQRLQRLVVDVVIGVEASHHISQGFMLDQVRFLVGVFQGVAPFRDVSPVIQPTAPLLYNYTAEFA